MTLSVAFRFVILFFYFVGANQEGALCREGKICMLDAKRSVYYFPSQNQLTLPCEGFLKSKNASFNSTITITWSWQSFFGPAAPQRLAEWNETVEVMNGSLIRNPSDMRKTSSIERITYLGSNNILWGIKQNHLPKMLQYGEAICHVSGVGETHVTAKMARPPTFIDINQGDTGSHQTWLETDSEVTTRKVVGVAGNILSLNCMTDGSPQPEITWLIDGMQLDNSTVTSRKTGFQLTISNLKIVLTRSHHGAAIECSSQSNTLDSQSETLLSTALQLDVVAAPTIIEIHQRGGSWLMGGLKANNNRSNGVTWAVLNGSLIAIRCISNCLGSCNYTWLFRPASRENTSAMELNSTSKNRDTSSEMKINASSAMAGNYQCIVKGSAGSIRSNWQRIEVHWPPQPPVISWSKGERQIGLKCESLDMGMPPAAVKWTSSGNELNVTEEGVLVVPQDGTDILEVECSIANVVGNQSVKIFLALREKLGQESEEEPSKTSKAKTITSLPVLMTITGNNSTIKRQQKPAPDKKLMGKSAMMKLKERRPKTDTASSLITAAIIITGLAICAILIATAMRCSLDRERTVVIEADDGRLRHHSKTSMRELQSRTSRSFSSESRTAEERSIEEDELRGREEDELRGQDEDEPRVRDEDDFDSEFDHDDGSSLGLAYHVGDDASGTCDLALHDRFTDISHMINREAVAQRNREVVDQINKEAIDERKTEMVGEDERNKAGESDEIDRGLSPKPSIFDILHDAFGSDQDNEVSNAAKDHFEDEASISTKELSEEEPSLQLSNSAELIGHYVNDLQSFFTIIDDLTRVLHEEAEAEAGSTAENND